MSKTPEKSPADAAGTATVTLGTPVTIEGREVAEIVLRKPGAGELRGLKLTEVLQLDVTAMMNLLPRISTPYLDAGTLAKMDLADFTALATEALGFFAPRSVKEQLGIG